MSSSISKANSSQLSGNCIFKQPKYNTSLWLTKVTFVILGKKSTIFGTYYWFLISDKGFGRSAKSCPLCSNDFYAEDFMKEKNNSNGRLDTKVTGNRLLLINAYSF